MWAKFGLWTVWEYTNKAASEIKMKMIGKGALLVLDKVIILATLIRFTPH